MAEPILKLDRYHLVEEIGSGGMATVYRAVNTGPMGFEKQAAVKLLHTEYGAGSDVVRMFIDEARVGAKLSHPNVIGVTDFGQIENRYFMAMEYVDGCNLSGLMKPGARKVSRPVPVEAAVCVMLDVLDGLEYVHSARDEKNRALGIVHRDISPQNIMIDRSGRARIGDFGIATGQFRESFTSAGIVKGKVSYMSPEQAAGKPLDRRSDIAAAGLTLFAAISGHAAFGTGDTMTVLARAESGLSVDEMTDIDCPDSLKQVLLKATTAKIEERYQNAAQFRHALAAALPEAESQGREMLRKMVAKAARKTPPRETSAAGSPRTEKKRTATKREASVFSRTMPATPVSTSTMTAYRVLTVAILAICVAALVMSL